MLLRGYLWAESSVNRIFKFDGFPAPFVGRAAENRNIDTDNGTLNNCVNV